MSKPYGLAIIFAIIGAFLGMFNNAPLLYAAAGFILVLVITSQRRITELAAELAELRHRRNRLILPRQKHPQTNTSMSQEPKPASHWIRPSQILLRPQRFLHRHRPPRKNQLPQASGKPTLPRQHRPRGRHSRMPLHRNGSTTSAT